MMYTRDFQDFPVGTVVRISHLEAADGNMSETEFNIQRQFIGQLGKVTEINNDGIYLDISKNCLWYPNELNIIDAPMRTDRGVSQI